jgi:hypothetical protein
MTAEYWLITYTSNAPRHRGIYFRATHKGSVMDFAKESGDFDDGPYFVISATAISKEDHEWGKDNI